MKTKSPTDMSHMRLDANQQHLSGISNSSLIAEVWDYLCHQNWRNWQQTLQNHLLYQGKLNTFNPISNPDKLHLKEEEMMLIYDGYIKIVDKFC